jgi:transposase-like protein
MARRHPAEARVEARRLRGLGASVTAIAAELGVSSSTVSSWTADLGLELRRRAWGGEVRLADRLDLRDRAVELRRRGLSTTEIARELGIQRSSTLCSWLAGTPPPVWTARPRAKDDLRDQARELRLAGLTYPEIAQKLGVSKSSISLWVRDLPAPDRRSSDHARQMGRAYWDAENARRDVAREQTKSHAAEQVGALTDRELLLVGAALYWAEGVKDKPWSRRECLVFINSDARVIETYLAWLDVLGIEESRRSYRLSIHESADVAAAHEFWSAVVGVAVDRFLTPTLKRHNPQTVRLNVGADYHGCLIVRAARSRIEYQRMDGIFRAIVASAQQERAADDQQTRD